MLAELGAVLLLVRLLSGRLYGWIDRHFFREAVNTERLLSELSLLAVNRPREFVPIIWLPK